MNNMLNSSEFNHGKCEKWMQQAVQMVELADKERAEGNYLWSYYKAHQSAEYALKGILRGIGSYASDHSVSKLLTLLRQEGINIDESFNTCARLLDRYYILPGEMESFVEGSPFECLDRSEVEKVVECAKNMITYAQGRKFLK